jgi:photosystem II stability/assembly factor-like uncharacterized protein
MSSVRWIIALLLTTHLTGTVNFRIGASNPVTLIQADPHHPGTLLAGTVAAQLFRSHDAGLSWQPLPFPGALRANLHALVIDPKEPDVYLAALSSEVSRYAGVFRTIDGGASWQPVSGLEQRQAWALAFWAGDPRIIAAGTQDGVFLSRDGGGNWKRLASPNSAWPQPVVSLTFDPKDPTIIYAGTPHLAWKTTDGGLRWVRLSKGMQDDSDVFTIDVDGSRRTHLLAGACSGIYRSFDGGATWRSLQDVTGGEHRTYAVSRPPQRPNVVFAATSGGLMQSGDRGTTWQLVSPQPARSIAFDPADDRFVFVASEQGILRSDDGGAHFIRLETVSIF